MDSNLACRDQGKEVQIVHVSSGVQRQLLQERQCSSKGPSSSSSHRSPGNGIVRGRREGSGKGTASSGKLKSFNGNSSRSSSDKTLLKLPERSLKLRSPGEKDVSVYRRFKYKKDMPLFPKVPITYPEKKLAKISLSRMKTWTLDKEIGESYLHRAAKENDPQVTLYCLKFDGFHPRCTNNRGSTPLHEACKVGSLQVAKILLDHGAYHSQPAMGNIRPIHIASQVGSLELVALLQSYGANPHLPTLGGTNCFDLAEPHPNVLKYLTETCSSQTNTELII